MSLPDISVVIPCYNAEEWVGRAIESVLAQEGVSVEVVVIDDGSTDGSVLVLRTYGDRIRWETGPNRGSCAARNRGLALARAEYVMFLDADDYLEGPFLVSAVAALRSDCADLAFGRIEIETANERVPFALSRCTTAKDVMQAFLGEGFIPPCGTVWSATFIHSIGGWKENLRRHQDYELTFRALSTLPSISLFEGGRGIYFQHATSSRISRQTDLDTVVDQARVIRFVGDCLAKTCIPESTRSELLRKRAYRLWQQTCRTGDSKAMRVGRGLYREFGGTGHIGSLAHRIFATMLGLRTKEWISQRVTMTRRKLGLKPHSKPS